MVDQIVLSPDTYFSVPPGAGNNDVTILPESPPPGDPTCGQTVSPTTASVTSAGGPLTVTVTDTGSCAWSAASNASWITIASGASGTGSGSVSLTVAAHTDAVARTGAVTIAGQVYTVAQDAAAPPPCTATLSAAGSSAGSDGGSGTVDAIVDASCAWSASSSASWLVITSGESGTGSGTVSFTVAANTGAARTATLTIAGATYTVTQSSAPAQACSVTLDKTSILVGGPEANWSIIVTASDSTCTWTASSDAEWLVVRSTAPMPMPVSGSGSVKVRALVNSGNPRRVGHVIINGVVYTVTQSGS
jgi:hypothetical protein